MYYILQVRQRANAEIDKHGNVAATEQPLRKMMSVH